MAGSVNAWFCVRPGVSSGGHGGADISTDPSESANSGTSSASRHNRAPCGGSSSIRRLSGLPPGQARPLLPRRGNCVASGRVRAGQRARRPTASTAPRVQHGGRRPREEGEHIVCPWHGWHWTRRHHSLIPYSKIGGKQNVRIKPTRSRSVGFSWCGTNSTARRPVLAASWRARTRDR